MYPIDYVGSLEKQYLYESSDNGLGRQGSGNGESEASKNELSNTKASDNTYDIRHLECPEEKMDDEPKHFLNHIELQSPRTSPPTLRRSAIRPV